MHARRSDEPTSLLTSPLAGWRNLFPRMILTATCGCAIVHQYQSPPARVSVDGGPTSHGSSGVLWTSIRLIWRETVLRIAKSSGDRWRMQVEESSITVTRRL